MVVCYSWDRNMKKWEQKEASDSKSFQGRRVRGSGNKWNNPGDVKTDTFLIDSKQTEKKSYSISLETWDKLYSEALFSFRLPLLSIKIQDKELVVMDKEDFMKLVAHDF